MRRVNIADVFFGVAGIGAVAWGARTAFVLAAEAEVTWLQVLIAIGIGVYIGVVARLPRGRFPLLVQGVMLIWGLGFLYLLQISVGTGMHVGLSVALLIVCADYFWRRFTESRHSREMGGS